MKILLFPLLFMLAAPCGAQELNLLVGGMRETSSEDTSFAWSLDYRQGLGEHLALTISWQNEGHIEDHHRDGHSIQLWARTGVLDRRLSLAAGAGPYRYYDTTQGSSDGQFVNRHGWGSIFSLAATYYTPSGFLYEARANRIVSNSSFDTTSLLFGIGYQLERPTLVGPSTSPLSTAETSNEIAAFVGRTIVNSFESQHGAAFAAEYRRRVTPHFDLSVSWLDEGDVGLIRRNGIAAQVWAIQEFNGGRLALGAGLGPYFNKDRYRPAPGEEDDITTATIITGTAALRLGPRTFVRGSWNRIVSDHNRDSDLLLLGLGYRF